MRRNVLIFLTISILTILTAGQLPARGNKDGPVVYVVTQGLFYDAVVTADPLPMKGPFQQLFECEVDATLGLCTEFGPGDFGYYGGRWWVDGGDGIMDETDHFFSCPLLGPGRETP